uniref:Uncharacterized protein n=1 Tax=Anguilla anguilla TaxID=7936 RepID=A0A0E9XV48_ANGAN
MGKFFSSGLSSISVLSPFDVNRFFLLCRTLRLRRNHRTVRAICKDKSNASFFFSCPKDWACVTLSEKNAVGRKPDQLRRLVCIESFVHKRVWAAVAAECTDFCLLMGVLCCSRLILGIKKSFATFCLLGQVCFFSHGLRKL